MAAAGTFLESIVVLELGSRVAVGATGDVLAQLGATVISIELPTWSNKGKWANRAAAMAGKKSVLADGGARDKLLAAADVVLLSTDVDLGDLRLWDHGPDGAILCDITAFGHTGPLAGTPLQEGLVEAMCGIVDTTGIPGEAPLPIGTPLVDMHTALLASGALIAGLRVRRLQGIAERIDIALYDVGVTQMINFLALHASGKLVTRSGNRHPLYNPWGAFEASDGRVLICAVTDAQWGVICNIIGRPELANDPQFANTVVRLENHLLLEGHVSAWVRSKTVAEVEDLLIGNGIAAGRIVPVSEIAEDINIRHRGSVRSIPNRSENDQRLCSASPFRSIPVSGRSAEFVPAKGEDSALVSQIRRRPSAAPTSGPYGKPYHGVRIVEIGQYTVAPLAARLFGALGADVIKVEAPAGDAIRFAAPIRPDGASYIFAISNTDKRGIVLNLQLERDRVTLHEILETADALIENLRPNSLAKQGFDTETLRRRHPHLIYCAVSGFGAYSAYPGRPALDTVIQAMSGLMDVTLSGGQPVKAGISASDNLGGQFGFVAVSAALELRERTGQAVHFDISMQDVSAWATQLEWNGDRSQRPIIMKCADGFVARDGDTPNCSDTHSRLEIVSSIPASSVAPVHNVAEVMAHPQTEARNLVVNVATPQGDSWPVYALPFKMKYAPIGVASVMGLLGSANDDIRRELKQRERRIASEDRIYPTSATGEK